MQKLYLKIKDHWLFWLFTIVLTVITTELFGEINFTALINKIKFVPSKYLFLLFELLKIKIPLFGFLFAAIITYVGLRAYNKYFILTKRGLEVLSAVYGAGGKNINITNELNKAVIDNKLKIVLSNNIAGDPVFGTKKEGVVKYKFNGKEFEKKYAEGDVIELF